MGSTYSIPSSPESVSDEDNHPKARPWYEPEWTPEQLGIVPKAPKRKCKDQYVSTAWVHHPDPDRVDRVEHRSVDEQNRRLKKQLRAEKKEEEAEARREEKATWRRIKMAWEKADDETREANARDLAIRERANMAADWK